MFFKTHSALAIAALALILSACSGTTTSAADTDTQAEGGGSDQTSSDQTEVAAAVEDNEPTGTLTLADGTIIEFIVGSCKTKATDPSSFLIDNGFDISGNSLDDFYHFGAIKAGVEGDPAPLIDLTGERDENRVNPKIEYINNGTGGDVPPTVAAEGTRVHGEVVLRDFHSQNAVFGETLTATVDFVCG